MRRVSRAGLRLSLRPRILYACAAIFLTLTLSLLVLLCVDVYLHGKFEKSAGFNVWGYRGPVAGRKQAGEYRVVVLGGSAAFGFGTSWDEAVPAQLERQLAGRSAGPFQTFRVINLGYNNEGVYSFVFTLRDYLSLDYDLACLYEGYNDLMGDRRPNLSVFRHDSPVFRLTGYLPIFPIVFKEKASAMVHGDAGAVYRSSGKTVFRPGVGARAAAGVLNATASVGQALERGLGRVTAEAPRGTALDERTGCRSPWQQYCRSIGDAVELARRADKQVLVMTQPYDSLTVQERARHIEQQSEMAAMLARRFNGDPMVRYVNLGTTIDLLDPALSFDRMHLTPEGNRRVAQALVAPVTAMASARRLKGEPRGEQ
jgi:hypothetical protein